MWLDTLGFQGRATPKSGWILSRIVSWAEKDQIRSQNLQNRVSLPSRFDSGGIGCVSEEQYPIDTQKYRNTPEIGSSRRERAVRNRMPLSFSLSLSLPLPYFWARASQFQASFRRRTGKENGYIVHRWSQGYSTLYIVGFKQNPFPKMLKNPEINILMPKIGLKRPQNRLQRP